MGKYIHEQNEWPHFVWDANEVLPLISQIRHQQGRLAGWMDTQSADLQTYAQLDALTEEVVRSTEIEGAMLPPDTVRSSFAFHLGREITRTIPPHRDAEGMVSVLVDATRNNTNTLDAQRLFRWHHALFPRGKSGFQNIVVGTWRTGERGPMQIVSGVLGRERVHFVAPDAQKIPQEMQQFLEWVNTENGIEPLLKAGIAHLWFVTIHPFEDGNGRLARVITELLLARAEASSQRYYSLSAQILKRRKSYYSVLEQTQKGNLDITAWLRWFLETLSAAITRALHLQSRVIQKMQFWEKHAQADLNTRQRKVLNMLLEDFEGKLTTSKWAKLAKCSQDTALRDIQALIALGILQKEPSGGRSTAYLLAEV